MMEARHISRRFGSVEALLDVSLQVGDGEIVALLGANGAGKSTMFDILATLDPGYEGTASIAGFNVRTHPAEVRERIGYVPGRISLYEDLSVAENLEFFAQAYGCDPQRITELSPRLWASLAPLADRRVRTLSGGMKQKLAFCCAVIHSPRALLLDEPTVGIDPAARRDLWEAVAGLAHKGVPILISTHYLDEAEAADRVLFLHRGRLLADTQPAELLRQTGRASLEEALSILMEFQPDRL